jgi:hypothetical protein
MNHRGHREKQKRETQKEIANSVILDLFKLCDLCG